MRCPGCDLENPVGMNFCGGCGGALARICSKCAQPLPAGFRFCGHCGHAVVTSTAPPPTPQIPRDAERRHLTVMFCDLVGSTELAGELDPEDLRRVIVGYQEVVTEVVTRYDGHIAQHLGDGLLIYFGYPRAHEDTARRALAAGLDIIDAVQNLPLPRPTGTTGLSVRLGVHTGQVVIGDIGTGDNRSRLALGSTPNVAARIEAMAKPDTMVVSSTTRALVGQLFEFAELGEQAFKGVRLPMLVYEVRREHSSQQLTLRSPEDAPMIGRRVELEVLEDRLERARRGSGQVALLLGQAGVGKSRLLQEFQRTVDDGRLTWLICGCAPHRQSSALSPIIDLLLRVIELDANVDNDEKIARIEQIFIRFGHKAEEVVPLIADLLALPLPTRYLAPALTPQLKKERTLALLLDSFSQASRQRLLVLAIEDLHWADPSTLDFIGQLAKASLANPIFIFLTARVPFEQPIPAENLVRLTITNVDALQAERIITGVAGGKSLPAVVLRQIIERTDGIPLFIEELTKMVLENDAMQERGDHFELVGDLEALAIPDTLRDSLTARLDRLGEARDIAQLASVLGREFSYDVLAAVWSLDRRLLDRHLGTLVHSELVTEQPLSSRRSYMFRHALIRDTAYDMLLKTVRQQHHKRVADALIEHFAEQVSTEPELVAHHYSEAGIADRASQYWLQAGRRSQGRSANQEALGHLRKGLAVLSELPDSEERRRQEVTLQIAMAGTLVALQGFVSQDVERTYRRAQELCRELSDVPDLYWVLLGFRNFHMVRAELVQATRFAEQMETIAAELGAPDLAAIARGHLGDTAFFKGNFLTALEHFASVEHIGADGATAYRARNASEFEVQILALKALTTWHLGYPDQSLALTEQAIALARLKDPAHSLAIALSMAGAQASFFRRDPVAVERYVTEIRRLSTERGIRFWGMFSEIFAGWAAFEKERRSANPDRYVLEEALKQVHGCIEVYQRSGSALSAGHHATILIEMLCHLGQAEQARPLIQHWLAFAERTTANYFTAELHRLHGDALVSGLPFEPDRVRALADAETAYQTAIRVAQGQSARIFELRAATSLARLWSSQDRLHAAMELLGPLLASFAEGSGTPDLQAASAVFDQIEHQISQAAPVK